MSKMIRLAIVTTHPVQYYAPVFKLLHQRGEINVKIFYTWGVNSTNKYDPGFNKKIEWDIPLLEGYNYAWVKNDSKDPGTHHFNGIINPDLISQIESWQPDTILFYGWGFNSHLKAIRYFKNKIPVWFRGDSTLLDERKGIKALLRAIFLRWVYWHVDHAFYVGINSKAYYKKYGLTEDQLSFAPHAIDNSRFASDRTSDSMLLKQQFGIADDDLVILFAGKLEKKKSPSLLLEAFLKLNKDNVHLLFVGNGPLEEELKIQAKENQNIHFMNFQNQSLMPVIYQLCDIFCLPSNGPNETWGLAINEAMASGKAILASDKVGAAVDLVKPGQNGEVFKSGDVFNLFLNLKKLVSAGKNELAKMGEYSQILIKDWSFDTQVKVIESITKHG
jgi:glycosyltransferase involved in cell wall biosynthesis